MSACRSCGASIEWTRTTEGNMMPLDVDPREDGNVVRTGSRSRTKAGTDVDVVRVIDADAPSLPGIDPPERYVAHFVTCPDADHWRRP